MIIPGLRTKAKNEMTSLYHSVVAKWKVALCNLTREKDRFVSDAAPWGLLEIYWSFAETFCFCLQGRSSLPLRSLWRFCYNVRLSLWKTKCNLHVTFSDLMLCCIYCAFYRESKSTNKHKRLLTPIGSICNPYRRFDKLITIFRRYLSGN